MNKEYKERLLKLAAELVAKGLSSSSTCIIDAAAELEKQEQEKKAA